ncbi:hypothetical protein ABT160_44115 [Streptomyces sp. NPDC001941]|uniref:hypothetical protein n=1 Tax=Streptomyces sp. NPDC001941 TaxID=3154659 RepID=UPI003328BD70
MTRFTRLVTAVAVPAFAAGAALLVASPAHAAGETFRCQIVVDQLDAGTGIVNAEFCNGVTPGSIVAQFVRIVEPDYVIKSVDGTKSYTCTGQGMSAANLAVNGTKCTRNT